MQYELAAPALLSLILLAGCGEKGAYELQHVGNQNYLLNKWTGGVRLIDGATVIEIKAPVGSSGGSTTKAKTWPPITTTSLGSNPITINLNTKYRDGQLLYIASVSPYEGVVEKQSELPYGNAQFMLGMKDIEGFGVGMPITLALKQGTGVVDEKGKRSHLQWSGSVMMSIETYSESASMDLQWRGFPDPTKQVAP